MHMTCLKPVVRWTSYAAAAPQHHKTCSCRFIPTHQPPLTNSNWFAPIHSDSSNRLNIVESSKATHFHYLYDDDRTTTDHQQPMEEKEEEEEEDINSQKLDQWVRDTAVEIVKNIDEAPFLVHIYCNDTNRDGSTLNTSIETVKEKAVADNWPMIEGRWKQGCRTPNGVILVEQLDHVEPETQSTKLWGILIQGKRKSCTACYLLKTSRVRGEAGLCTHFCLLRVDCSAEHADIQLKKSWLQMA